VNRSTYCVAPGRSAGNMSTQYWAVGPRSDALMLLICAAVITAW